MKNARWVRLADDLTRGITNGDYPLDSYLPTEMELCGYRQREAGEVPARIDMERIRTYGANSRRITTV